MLQVVKSKWRNLWHVYDIDTGGTVWLATFRRPQDAYDWVTRHYEEEF